MDYVSIIINEVRKENDDALKKFTNEFYGADIVNIEVEDIEIENAYEEVEPELIEVIVCRPPNKDGKIYPLTPVAADMAGADRIFKVGGGDCSHGF